MSIHPTFPIKKTYGRESNKLCVMMENTINRHVVEKYDEFSSLENLQRTSSNIDFSSLS